MSFETSKCTETGLGVRWGKMQAYSNLSCHSFGFSGSAGQRVSGSVSE